MIFPSIDKQQALRQLELLGHNSNDNIYLRFFYPSNDPRKEGDKGRKSDRLNYHEIEAYQRQGRGAYFVINGGGHKNEDVLTGRALFLEHDNLDKQIQLELWKTLELPEPTFQVDTGGKSIHSYWVLSEPIPIEQWCELQRDLLEFADGDRSIKNPARVMRLAGAWHISHDESGHPVHTPTRIVAESGQKYSCEQLRAAIPHSQQQDPFPLIEQVAAVTDGLNSSPHSSTERELPRHPDFIQVPVAAAVPLTCCLSKESRQLLEGGTGQGGRNTGGAKLARDLIGTESYLRSICQSVEGYPRQLMEEYASRCTPPLPAREVDSIWKSASASQPTPSCGSEGVEACIRGWYWREHVKPSLSRPPSNSQSPNPPHRPKISQSDRPSQVPPVSEASLAQRIDNILDLNLDESEQDLALVELAKKLDNYNAAEIRTIAAKRIEERYSQDNLSERQQELERLESWETEEYLPFRDLFYASPDTVKAFEHLCHINKKIQPQYFLSLLSPVSSLIGIKGCIKAPVLGKFRSTVNIALVGESGEGKSIISSILLDPLYRLQKERRQDNKQQREQYGLAVEAWERQHPDLRGPKPREDDFITTSDAFLVINEYSREGIVKNHADNPNGLLIHQEELVAIQRSQNMYRQGKGDDRQFLNNLYDNKCISRALKSERIVVEETAVSIFGGYQPAIILAEMGDLSDPDGQWARFNLINGIEKKVLTDLSQPSVDVSNLLYDLYRKALTHPCVECHFDAEGINQLQAFVNEMEELRWRTLQPGMRAVYSKAAGEVCRIALALHWINSLLSGDEVPQTIPAIALANAIKIKLYLLKQMQIIRTWGEASPKREETLAPAYRELQKLAARLKGSSKVLTVRMVQQARNTMFKALNAKAIEKLFKDFVAMGKAQLVPWKRGVALLIDSMFGDDGSTPPTGPDSPPGRGNCPGGSFPSDGQFGEALALNSFSPASVNHPVLLESVGGLLEQKKGLEASINNLLTSFVGSVGSVGRCFDFLSQLPLDLPTITTSPTVAQPLTQTELESVETTSTILQQNLEANQDVEWLVQLLADLEIESQPHPRFESSDHLVQLFNEAEQKLEQCRERVIQQCPDYEERLVAALAQVSESFCVVEGQAKSLEVCQERPTLAQLQALLLACQTLTELKSLKKKHSSRVHEAYKALSQQQQSLIDAVSATAVPHEVFKYTGPAIERDGQKLPPGALVFVDPHAKVHKSTGHVRVWLIRSLELGWQKAVSVSRNCLVLVEKAIAVGSELVEGEQGTLLDSLGG